AYMINMIKCFFCIVFLMIWFSIASAKILTPLMPGLVFNPGGDHGLFCCQWIENIIGAPGLYIILALTAIAFLAIVTKKTIEVVRKALNPMEALSGKVIFRVTNGPDENSESQEAQSSDPEVFDNPQTQTVEFPEGENPIVKETETGQDSEASQGDETSMRIIVPTGELSATGNNVSGEIDLSVPINPHEPWTKYKYPTLGLLKTYEDDGKPYIDMSEQKTNKNRIVDVLSNFGVQIKSITATVGPTITLYEITPAEGVRISKIKNLEDDIALSLAALGIRIIAPIPGKGTIGIEVPNAKQNIVSMESILNSKRFQDTKMELPLAFGKTITNEVFMTDLAKTPHLLVAGATGQGKSVGLNAIITSLLYKKHPNELKLVLIDPKKVEFSIYSSIANHFMAKIPDDEEDPIITDVTKVIRTLNSLCKLMDTRYDMLKLAGVRNIKEYNEKYVNHHLRLTDGHKYMPYIVVIIDEYGDLIMTAGKEIELPITRIAQLARAVGIHMVIATQRPTTNIITGSIKANFPGRMSFKVSSAIDSRTILDRTGADKLIGRGDMLYLNGTEPTRVQCAFVDTIEIDRINAFISDQAGPLAPMELPEPTSDETSFGGDSFDSQSIDPLFEESARHIVLTQQGSTSMIQRHFSIGYNRAGRIMDQLEKAGIVGVAQGSKPREVLIQDMASLEAILSKLRK
ncbi:MAG: DNA translocase FtsK, partial [Prevotella sp.]|nr:DNA translocase FtsK [Prevotella sp.]